MNKQEFEQVLSSELEKQGVQLSNRATEKVVTTFLSILSDSMVSGESVKFVGFGTFGTANRAPRKGRSVRDNRVINIPAKRVPKFSPGITLKRKVELE